MPNRRFGIAPPADRREGHIAEGAGEFSRADKQRFYRIAKRSATESAATLDIIARRNHAPPELLTKARGYLERIVAMLVRLSQSPSRS
jgi:four helix bundle protein